MKKRKFISRVVNLIYTVIALLFVADVFTSFQIKHEGIKVLVYYGVLFSTPLILLSNYLFLKPRFISTAIPVIMLIFVFTIGPTTILFSSSAWKTQTILYQNRQLKFKKIEVQMKDQGALGVDKRTVKVTYLTDLFMIADMVPQDIHQKIEWAEVNIHNNEVGIKNQ